MNTDAVIRRLRADTPYYVEHAGVKIVDGAGSIVPLVPRWGQLELDRALEEQRQAGKPMRALVLKSRKTGVSTWVQTKICHRVTMRANHRAATLAHDSATSTQLFQMAWTAYNQLEDDPLVKPPLMNFERSGYAAFGEQSRTLRSKGELGLNSSMSVDTAKEFESGRGFTVHSLHGSEVAFWPDIGRKLTAVLNMVTDHPDTMIVLESTANGSNHWKVLWDRAWQGKSEYAAVFIPWWRDPQCWRQFANEIDREDFIVSIGEHEFGEAEPLLVEQFACTPEQLHWRRWAVENRMMGDLLKFQQEYPATPEEAFLATSNTVFPTSSINRTIAAAERAPQPAQGVIDGSSTEMVESIRGEWIEVVTEVDWKDRAETDFGPRHSWWEQWETPTPDRPYVLGVDTAGMEVGTDHACHAAQVIDHKTRRQVAQLERQGDPDLFALEVLKAALLYNRAFVIVEMTGGYGSAVARRLYFDYGYDNLYFRKRLTDRRDKFEDRMGFDTNNTTKPLLVANAAEMLRKETHGIRSDRLAKQLAVFVKLNERGKTGAEPPNRVDMLLAWMLAQFGAVEEPIPDMTEFAQAVAISAGEIRRIGSY